MNKIIFEELDQTAELLRTECLKGYSGMVAYASGRFKGALSVAFACDAIPPGAFSLLSETANAWIDTSYAKSEAA